MVWSIFCTKKPRVFRRFGEFGGQYCSVMYCIATMCTFIRTLQVLPVSISLADNDDCLEDERKAYLEHCSVAHCVLQLCTFISNYWAVRNVQTLAVSLILNQVFIPHSVMKLSKKLYNVSNKMFMVSALSCKQKFQVFLRQYLWLVILTVCHAFHLADIRANVGHLPT